MKKFREFLGEGDESSGSTPARITLPPTDKQLSPGDEARRRMALEREMMGLPPAEDAYGGNAKSFIRMRDQAEFENERKFPEQTLQKFKDEDIKQSASSRERTLNQVQTAVNANISDPTVLSLINPPLSWLKGQAHTARTQAQKNLTANPTYASSNTEVIERAKKDKE